MGNRFFRIILSIKKVRYWLGNQQDWRGYSLVSIPLSLKSSLSLLLACLLMKIRVAASPFLNRMVFILILNALFFAWTAGVWPCVRNLLGKFIIFLQIYGCFAK